MRYSVWIKGNKLDLYGDETLQINSKLKDLREIDKVFSDYSQDFNCPATKANNNIFKHYYDATVEDGFDARVQVDARIELNGFIFKVGSIKLLSCTIKKNRITSYKIQFFTQIARIQDIIGDDSFRDIAWFDNFSHLFNLQNVQDGLTTGLNFNVPNGNKAIVYPLISYRDRWGYDTTSADIVDLKNNGIFFNDLKPAISYPAVMQSIREHYGLNFQSQVFERREFENAYINLNGKKEEGAGFSETFIGLFDASSAIIEADIIAIFLDLDITVDNQDFSYNLRITKEDDSGVTSIGYFTNLQGDQSISFQHDQNDTSSSLKYRYYIQTNEVLSFQISSSATIDYVSNSPGQIAGSLSGDTVINVRVNELFNEDLKVIDWLKSVFKTFNMVVEPNLFCTPIQEWFSQGKIKDFTKYVNQENVNIKPSALYNEIDLGWEANETFLASNFAQNNLVPFGSLEETILNEDGKKLEGKILSVELPFEKPIFEKIGGLSYGYFVDENKDVFRSLHSVFYIAKRDITDSGGMKIRDSNTTSVVNKINCPSTSIFGFALNWDNEFDEFEGVVMQDNIYKKYYKDYVDFILNIKRRNYSLEVELPLSKIQDLQQNDRIVIDNTRYLINSFKADLTRSVVKFDLFNDLLTSPKIIPPSQSRSAYGWYSSTGIHFHEFSEDYDDISADGAGINIIKVSPQQGVILFELEPNTSGNIKDYRIREVKTDGKREVIKRIGQNKKP